MRCFITFLSFIIIFSSPNLNKKSVEAMNDSVVIDMYKQDVTGDGFQEEIKLKGRLLSNESDFFSHIWAEIIKNNKTMWTIAYGPGYEPSLQFIDFNKSNSKEILYQSNFNKDSMGVVNYQLHTINKNELSKLTLPKHRYFSSNIKDNYIVEAKTSPKDFPLTLSIVPFKDIYLNHGFYSEQGETLKHSSIQLESIHLYEPLFIPNKNGFGLKTHQLITDTNLKITIGSLETLWYFCDKWIALETNIYPNK